VLVDLVDRHQSSCGLRRLEERPDGCQVQRPRAQGTRERSTPFGEIEAPQVGVQPRTPTGSGALRVDDDRGRTLVTTDLDHSQQDGPKASFPAPHARSQRTCERGRSRTHGVVGAVCSTFGEPDPWPSLG